MNESESEFNHAIFYMKEIYIGLLEESEPCCPQQFTEVQASLTRLYEIKKHL